MAQGAGHFVGRADELGVLSGLVAGLDRGRPGALGLTGEPASASRPAPRSSVRG
jgi:hypothetical protein